MWKNTALNIADYRELARQRLPAMVFDYLEGGAEDERGLAHNRAVFDNLRLYPSDWSTSASGICLLRCLANDSHCRC